MTANIKMSKIKEGRRVATLVSLMTMKKLAVKLNYTASVTSV